MLSVHDTKLMSQKTFRKHKSKLTCWRTQKKEHRLPVSSLPWKSLPSLLSSPYFSCLASSLLAPFFLSFLLVLFAVLPSANTLCILSFPLPPNYPHSPSNKWEPSVLVHPVSTKPNIAFKFCFLCTAEGTNAALCGDKTTSAGWWSRAVVAGSWSCRVYNIFRELGGGVGGVWRQEASPRGPGWHMG